MFNDHRIRFTPTIAALGTLMSVATSQSFGEEVPDALAAGWKGEKRCENVHEDDYIRVLRCVFPPAQGHERHSHPASFIYIMGGGRGMVTNANGTRHFEVKSDETRVTKRIAWHEMENTGDTDLRYLIVEKKYQPEGSK